MPFLSDVRSVAGRTLRDVRDRVHARAIRWHEVDGLRLLGGNWMAAGGDHEAVELGLFREALDSIDAVVDVGANSGLYSLIAARAGKACFAFEPQAENLRILYQNVAANGFDEAIEVFPLAASDRVGSARFYGRGQGASLLSGWAGQPDYDFEWVATNTLDNLLLARLAGRRLFLKIDVEGAELQVLRGGRGLLTLASGVLLEHSLTRNQPGGTNPHFAELFELMWAAGFHACAADAAQTPVDGERVRAWIAAGRTDCGTENFVFRR